MVNSTTETTEIVLRNDAIVLVTQDFATKYPALAPDEDTLELLEENLGSDGENIGLGDLKRVKVPSSDLAAWMIQRAGKSVAEEELTGVLVAWKARRSLWIKAEPDGSPPDCHSLDNRRPVAIGMYGPQGERAAQNPGGTCASCPMSKFGSAIGRDGAPGRGTACKEQRLLFLVVPGALFPLVVHVPRTSIRGVKTFMLDLIDVGKKYSQVEVGLKLVRDKNKDNQDFNRIEVRAIRFLEPGECEATKLYGAQFKQVIDAAMADFSAEAVSDQGGGIDIVPEEMPQEMPA